MYHIMILDDEPNIVDGLYALLSDTFGDTVEVYTAYASNDALKMLRSRPIDILVLDIRMPGMNGIEILDWIEKERPKVRVLLLTGYNDLQYVQSAMWHHCCVGYILKAQGDEALLSEIRRQMGELENIAKQQLARCDEKYHEKELHDSVLSVWLSGRMLTGNTTIYQIDKTQPIFPVICRYHLPENISMFQAVRATEQVLDNALPQLTKRENIICENSNVLWLLQLTDSTSLFPGADDLAAALQYTADKLDSLNVEIIACDHMCAAENVNAKMKEMLSIPVKSSSVTILKNSPETTAEYIRQLHQSLHDGNSESLERLLHEGRFEMLYEIPENRMQFLALLLDISLNNRQTDENMHKVSVAIKDMMINLHGNPHEYRSLARKCCSRVESLGSGDSLVQFVMDYIEKHLCDSDLSLTSIAIATTYNPVYLSRIVKQKCGKGVLEIINDKRYEKAREMLLEGKMRIQEITQKVGFQSPSYFAFFFRKKTGMTPSMFLRRNNIISGDE